MRDDYHQYFIKDGRHIGKYDEMYRNCDDPWNIEKMGVRLDMEAALLLIKGECGKIKKFLDIGAGLGLFSELLCAHIWNEKPDAKGLISDISITALKSTERRLRNPRLNFAVLDARDNRQILDYGDESFDLLVMAQVLWSLLENLDNTLRAFHSVLKPGGHLLVSQHFLQPGQQNYGSDIVSSPDDLIKYLRLAGFTIKKTLETNRHVNHHWAALMEKEN